MASGPIRAAARRLGDRLRSTPPPPCAAVLGAGGSGKSGLVDELVLARSFAGLPTVRVNVSPFRPDAGADAFAVLEPGTVLVVDDAQWLAPALLDQLAARAEEAVDMASSVVVALRPQLDSPAAARLVELAAAHGALVRLGPLDDDELVAGLTELLSSPPDPELVDRVRRDTGGNPLLVDRLVRAWLDDGLIVRGALDPELGGAEVSQAFCDALLGRLARLDAAARTALAALCVLGGDEGARLQLAVRQPAAVTELTLWGLVADGVVVAPVLAAAAPRLLDAAQMAQGAALAAQLAGELGGAPDDVAAHHWAARAQGAEALASYLAAGDHLLGGDPDAALDWYDRAFALDASSVAARAGRAAAAAACGDAAAALTDAQAVLRERPDDPVAAAVVAAVFAQQGLWRDAARTLNLVRAHPRRPDAFWRWQAVCCSALAGDWAAARHGAAALEADAAVPDPLTGVVAKAATALLDSPSRDADQLRSVLAGLREVAAFGAVHNVAAEAALSPHELGAAVALGAGELLLARQLLAVDDGNGIRQVEVGRLGRWVELRLGSSLAAGRAVDTVDGGGTGSEPGDASPAAPAPGSAGSGPGGSADAPAAPLVALALDAVVARRSGDVNVGGAVAKRLAAVVATAQLDLLNLDAASELAVLARRFGPPGAAAELARRTDAVLASVDEAPLWAARVHWSRLEAAVAVRSVDEIAARRGPIEQAAAVLAGLTPLALAAEAWAAVMGAGASGSDEHASLVDAAVAGLRDAEMAWEAAHLAGQAAIRVEDGQRAKSLLGQARSLRSRSGSSDGDRGAVTPAGLSEREVEVGQLVLDGLTHKAVGEALFISPKTVEHHVAHIRQKLGVTTRAEFRAALRDDLAALDG